VHIELENLDTFTLQQLDIDDALMVISLLLCSFGNYFVLKISSKHVGSVLIYKTIFSQLPSPGLTMENTGKVSIIDSVFNNTASGSIIVDTANEVEIVNNQFSIDTLEVLKMYQSPNLYISCNRLIGEAIHVECSTISSSVHIVSSSRISSSNSTMPSLAAASLDIKSEKQDSTSVNTILWVLVAVGLIVLSVFFLCICWKRRQHQKQKDEEKSAFKAQIETETIGSKQNEEKAVMLPTEFVSAKKAMLEHVTDVNTVVTSDNSADDIIEKVKEQEIILQREIQGTRSVP
jgi:hypothetical protein